MTTKKLKCFREGIQFVKGGWEGFRMEMEVLFNYGRDGSLTAHFELKKYQLPLVNLWAVNFRIWNFEHGTMFKLMLCLMRFSFEVGW